jgi:hypothetical protein
MSWSIFDFKQKFKKIRAHEYYYRKKFGIFFNHILHNFHQRMSGMSGNWYKNNRFYSSFKQSIQYILFFATSKVKVRIHESSLLFSSIRFHLLLPLPHSYQLYIWNNCVFHVNYCNFESMTLNINIKHQLFEMWLLKLISWFENWYWLLNKSIDYIILIVWKNKNNSDAI